MRAPAAAVLALAATTSRTSAQVAAADGVLASFRRAPIVALADAHRDQTIASFRLALIQRPDFAAPGRVVAIEWGNPLYQGILDRYVAGDSVPVDSLRLVWRNAIGNLNGICDSPVYEEIVAAVRSVNRGLPANRRVRVLACDAPIDWDRVRTRDEVLRIAASRDEFCADVLEREVLTRHRSALLILGGGHLLRGVASDIPGPNVAERLDRAHPGSVFVVTTRKSRNTDELTRAWPAPSFLALHGTPLGRDTTECGPFETIADAFLLLGRGAGRPVDADPAIYDGTAYGRELDRRWCLVHGRPFPAAHPHTELSC